MLEDIRIMAELDVFLAALLEVGEKGDGLVTQISKSHLGGGLH